MQRLQIQTTQTQSNTPVKNIAVCKTRQKSKSKTKPFICFDVRAMVYTYMPLKQIFKISRHLCKTEFGRVLRLGTIISKDRKEDTLEIILPDPLEVQNVLSSGSQGFWDFFFLLVPKPVLKLHTDSSTLLAMSLLERYALFHSKISLEFEITGFHDCNQWAHLLMILTKRGLNG